jgi:hypothetical protein
VGGGLPWGFCCRPEGVGGECPWSLVCCISIDLDNPRDVLTKKINLDPTLMRLSDIEIHFFTDKKSHLVPKGRWPLNELNDADTAYLFLRPTL